MLLNQSKAYSINLAAQHENRMSRFELALRSGKLVKINAYCLILEPLPNPN